MLGSEPLGDHAAAPYLIALWSNNTSGIPCLPEMVLQIRDLQPIMLAAMDAVVTFKDSSSSNGQAGGKTEEVAGINEAL